MRTIHWIAMLAIVGASFVACGNPGAVGSSTALTAPSAVASRVMSAGPSLRQVSMMDACDPSFNLVIGPGTCARNGGVNFTEFVAEVTAHHEAGAWHNSPSQTDSWLGDSLVAVNKGGETHTFTRVADFGGGIVGFLNDLAGTPNVRPECSAETTFVPPGGTDSESLDQVGVLKFQCCIHPWMHTTVLVKSH